MRPAFSDWECTLNGNWVRINNGKVEYRIADGSGVQGQGADVNSLTAGQIFTDQFVYAIRLGNGTLSEATVKINITGANDTATIGGDDGANDRAVSEAGLNQRHTTFPAIPTPAAELTFSDADRRREPLPTLPATGTLWRLHLQRPMVWTYTLNNGTRQSQSLTQGEVVTDTLTVTSAEAAPTEPVTITITGTNDAPVAQPTRSAATENATIRSTARSPNDSDVDTRRDADRTRSPLSRRL